MIIHIPLQSMITIDGLCTSLFNAIPFLDILEFTSFSRNASLIHNVIKLIQLEYDITILKDRIHIRIGAHI